VLVVFGEFVNFGFDELKGSFVVCVFFVFFDVDVEACGFFH